MQRSKTILAIIITIAAVTVISWITLTPSSGHPTQTQWGPVDDADRDLLARVRLAGLWEHPLGHDMAQRATQPEVRDAGEKISQEHLQLNQLNDDVAAKLGVPLPTKPLASQQAYVEQVAATSGPELGPMAVNILRASHGSILPQIEEVRVGTRNSLMRSFAEQAAAFVQRHINYLESTGLVDYTELPEAAPTEPGHAEVTADGKYQVTDGLASIGIAAIMVGMVLVGIFLWNAK